MTEQQIDIPLAQGLGADLDERIAPAGVLLTASNVEPSRVGRLRKRHGYRWLGQTCIDGATLDGPVLRVHEHAGAVVALRSYDRPDSTAPHSLDVRHATYAEDGTVWAPSHVGGGTHGDKGILPIVGRDDAVQTRRIRGGSGTTTNDLAPYAATIAKGHIEIVAYATLANECRIDVFDATTRARIATYTIGDHVMQVRAWHWGPSDDVVSVGWINSDSLALQAVSFDTEYWTAPSAPSVSTYSAAVSVDSTAGMNWDVVGRDDGAGAIVVVADPAADVACVQILQRGGTVTEADTDLDTPATTNCRVAVGVLGSTVAVAYVSLKDAQRQVRCAIYSSATGAPVLVYDGHLDDLATTGEAEALVVGVLRGARTTSAAQDAAIALWDVAASLPDAGEATRVMAMTRGGDVADVGTIYGVHPSSAVFANGHTPLVWLDDATTTILQRGRYLYCLPAYTYTLARVVARVAWGSAFDTTLAHYVQPRPSQGADGAWLAAWQEVVDGAIISTSNEQYAIVAHRTQITGHARALPATDGAGTVYAAGLALHYDGDRVAEVGWLQWPPLLSASTGAGTVPAGVYWYVAVYEEIDSAGDVHQSAPSIPLYVSISTAYAVTISTRAPYHTIRDLARQVRLALYRTKAGGTLYYRVGATLCVALPTATTITDNLTDAQLEAREPLRYSAGVIEPFAPPPSEGACEHGGRVWLASGRRAYHSHPRLAGWGVEFSAGGYVELPADVTAVASTGDALLALTAADAWLVWGDGPDRTDAGDFSLPAFAGAVGCPRALGGARSVARTRAGVTWRSDDGIYLLSRGAAAPELISGGVEDLLRTLPIVTYAVDDEAAGCIRYGLLDTDASDDEGADAASVELQYWYRAAPKPLWTSATAPTLGRRSGAVVAGAAVVGASGEYAASTSTAGVYRQGSTGHADYLAASVVSIAMIVATRGLYPAGRNAESRTRRIYLDGERVGASCSVRIDAVHDSTSATQRTLACSGTGALQVRYDCEIRRATSLRVTISESSSTSGVELAGITLVTEVVEPTARRLGSGERI